MKPLRIDLGRPQRGVERALAIAAAVLLLTSLALGAFAWSVDRRWLVPRGQASARPPAEAVRSDTAPVPYRDDAQVWLHLASAPVGRVLAAIESVDVPGVRVVLIDIDARARSVTVEIEAPGHDRAAAWFSRLAAAEAGCLWQLQRSQQVPLARPDAAPALPAYTQRALREGAGVLAAGSGAC